MKIINNTNIVFMHIPKTGGQSITSSFNMKSRGPAHSFSSPEDKNWIAGDFVRFCVVRDPIARFLSSYRYNVKANSLTPGLSHLIWADGLEKDINDFCLTVEQRPQRFRKFAHLYSQSFYISRIRPQIILRQEFLERDIEIIFKLAGVKPEQLLRKNISSPELHTGNLELNDRSVAFLRRKYALDYRILGYL